MKNDSIHVIFKLNIPDNIYIHRFTNPAGFPMSAIYEDDLELTNCETSEEKDMVYWFLTRNLTQEDSAYV